MKRLCAIFLFLFFAACQPSPEVIQNAIEQTQAAYTPTPTFVPVEAWNVTPYPGAYEYVSDLTVYGDEWDETVKNTSDVLNVPLPFRWETYLIKPENKYDQVAFHYTKILRNRGYSIEYTNYYSDRGKGVIIYSTPEKNIYVSVYEATPEYEYTAVFVIYKSMNE